MKPALKTKYFCGYDRVSVPQDAFNLATRQMVFSLYFSRKPNNLLE